MKLGRQETVRAADRPGRSRCLAVSAEDALNVFFPVDWLLFHVIFLSPAARATPDRRWPRYDRFVAEKVVPSSYIKFNAESIFMRTPHSVEADASHFAGFLLRILGAAFSNSNSLSVALKRPVRSFGAITDSKASSFTDGSARV